MQSIEHNAHSFVVKVWREETQQETRVVWRGHITHVPSGQRQFFTDLHEIPLFIEPYLAQLGVHLSRFARIQQMWRTWRSEYKRRP
jgi:hypothetical protein